MYKKYVKYSIVVGLILALFSQVYGQGPGDNTAGMLRAELERTDQLIERAQDAVRVSNGVRAQVALENAIELQSQAWDEYGKGNAGYGLAGTLTRQAREQAKSALASARYTQQNQDVVQRKLERTTELLQRTREQLSIEESNRVMAALYESAEDNLKNAYEFYRNGEYRPALKLANQVENAIRRIVSATNREAQGAAGFDRYSESVKELLEDARKQIAECDSETAIKLMEEARVTLEAASRLKSQGEPEKAMEALKTSRKLVTKARLECSGYDGSLSERYERIKSEADNVSELVAPDDEESHQLMDQVYEQLELAAGHIDARQTQEAAAALKAAQLTLNQVLKLLDAQSTE